MRIRHVRGAEEYLAANPLVIQDPAHCRGNWAEEVFGNRRPLRLEVGTGMGIFLRTQAALHPEINYIGLELNTTVLYKAIQRYLRERGLDPGRAAAVRVPCRPEPVSPDSTAAGQTGRARPQTGTHGTAPAVPVVPAVPAEALAEMNLRFIRSDARFLADYFAPGEVSRLYLNFSDPWPKDKNANKRLTSPVFLKLYRLILPAGGIIEFKTDNRSLFDYSVETFPQGGFVITELTYDLHADAAMNADNIMTEYEAKFSGKGNPICKLTARKS